MNRLILASLATAVAFTAAAGATDVVPRKQTSLPASSIGDGFVGRRLDANRNGSLKAFDIDRYVKMVEEKQQRDWWWIGEQPGKWLESAALTWEYSADVDLQDRAKQILARLEAAQEPEGYLGITDPSVRTAEQPLRGMDAYELYFMLHGLITASEVLHDTKALETASRLGDYFVDHIGPGKAEFWPSPYRPPENVNTIVCPQFTWVPEGTPKAPALHVQSEIAGHTAHYGWEGTLLIDPILRLHQATGKKEYLDWSRWVVDNIDRWSGWNSFSKLDQVADGTLGVHQLQPYVHSHTFQMNFLGFLRLYQITGDASLLRKVRGAWDDIARRQMYVTGGVSVGEHFEPGYIRPLTGEVVETCANMSWMQLTQYLLELTNEPRYADAVERLLFNHVFASQTVDGDCYRYHTPPNGFKPGDYFHGPDCCTASGHRIVSMLPRFIYGCGNNELYVNQFIPSTTDCTLSDGTVISLNQQTRFPEAPTVELRIDLKGQARFALNVRIPAWCEQPSLTINGESVPVRPGTYAKLDRTWKLGDTVKLDLPMTPKWTEHDHFEGGPAPWALMRGPVVYALDTVWWNSKDVPAPQDVANEASVIRSGSPRELPAASKALGPFYEVDVRLADNRTTKAILAPFANIGRWYREGEAKPEHGSKAFSYAVWLHDAQP
jgi:DUF1680 family protein